MTNAELTILTLISEQPQHAYQIEQVIEERGMREWTEIGFSSIYYLTQKLQKEGLIKARTEPAAGKGPARNVYHLTKAGTGALQAALIEALAVPQPRYTSFSLAIGNLPAVPHSKAVTALQAHHDALAERLAHGRDRLEAQKPLPYFVEALFDHSAMMIQAEMMWVEKFIKQVAEERDTMSKIDFKKELKDLYKPSGKAFAVVDVPPMQFLMIDGHGDPNTAQEYQAAVEALYGVSYKIKFMSKKELGRDYVVPPLQGLWWAEDMESFTSQRDKSQWNWTMMIMQPEWITQEIVESAVQEVEKKKGLPGLAKLRLETYHEGLSVQIMHTGSYDDEGPVLVELHSEFMPKNGYKEAGKHHEIYLSDPRKVAPEKLKTVLRQPVKKV